ncbi:uncharacterized protein LOC143920365 [Arctopsyche grandis]|uniref:uncharacterized protein LOC143920365 n=1 Tax=Arctopsyche grandis TaxID=121162 RepID=UPI00406D8B4A
MSAKSEKLNNIKINIKCIVVSNSLRMTVEDLSREYRQVEGRNLSVHEFGYSNLLDFLKRECTDIIRLQSVGTSYVICPIITKEIENLNSLIEKQKLPANVLSRNYRRNTSNVAVGKRSSIISDKSNTAAFKNATLMNNECTNVKENYINSQNVPKKNYKLVELKNELHQNLKMLIKDHRELWLSQLNDEYYKKFGRHLEYQKLGYVNVVALCRSMPHVFNIQRPDDYGDWKLYDRDSNLQHDFQRAPEKVDIPETSTLVSLEAKIFGLNALPGISLDPSLCPEECIDNEFQIRRASSPSVNSEILVSISEVVDPSHFWFHIVADEHSLALEKLMNSMDVLYRSSESYKMVRAQMKTGTHCAVPFEGLYHRAEIIANVDLEVVKVRYIDYGTILNVFCKDVRLLLKKFCELPVQAMRGRLSGVSPVHELWSSAARRRFFGLVNGIPLAAKVSSTHDNNISCLGLMNTSSGSKDVIIAKVLYFEGLANLDSSTDKYWTYKEHQYLLPTFEDLETGCAPNFTALEDAEELDLIFKKSVGLSRDSEDNFSVAKKDDIKPIDISKSFSLLKTSESKYPKESIEDQKLINSLIKPIDISHKSDNEQFENHDADNLSNDDEINVIPSTTNNNYDSRNSLHPISSHSYNNAWNEIKYPPPPPPPPLYYYPPPNFGNIWTPGSHHYGPPQHYNVYQNYWSPHSPSCISYPPPEFHIPQYSPFSAHTYCHVEQNYPASDDHSGSNYFSSPSESVIEPSPIQDLKVNDSKPSARRNSTFKQLNTENKLLLVGRELVGGCNLEIWQLKCVDNDETNPFIIVEQYATIFLQPTGKEELLSKIYSNVIALNITFMRHRELLDIVSDITQQGNSNLSIGEGILINSLTKDCPNSGGYFALLPLDNVVDVSFQYSDNLKVKLGHIIKDMLTIIKAYV